MGTVDPFIRDVLDAEPSFAWFGFEIHEATEGRAVISLVVAAGHVNANDMAHGAIVFAVADQAFAMAANTLIPHAATGDAQIHYLAPSRLGQRLEATARASWADERRAVVDVTVTADGTVVATYRGMARATRRA
ncbi:PaaI family thioesterase [Agromyces soli]